MAINVRTKGQEGEREVQRALEPIIRKVMTEGGFPAGFRANSSGNRFYESRCFDRDNNGIVLDKEGRLHEH